jgi:hypothetical protein
MISSSKQGFKGEVGQIFQKTLAPVCLDSVHVFQHIIRGRRVKMEGKAPHIANSEQKCVQFQKEQHAFSPSLGRHPQRTIKNPSTFIEATFFPWEKDSFFFSFLLLFICAYKAWVISPPCPHPLPYHPLHPLPLLPTPSIPSRNYFALISNFVVERV